MRHVAMACLLLCVEAQANTTRTTTNTTTNATTTMVTTAVEATNSPTNMSFSNGSAELIYITHVPTTFDLENRTTGQWTNESEAPIATTLAFTNTSSGSIVTSTSSATAVSIMKAAEPEPEPVPEVKTWKTLTCSIDMPELSAFANLSAWSAAYRAAVAAASHALESDTTVYIEGVGVQVELSFLNAAPNASVTRMSLAEHLGLAASIVNVSQTGSSEMSTTVGPQLGTSSDTTIKPSTNASSTTIYATANTTSTLSIATSTLSTTLISNATTTSISSTQAANSTLVTRLSNTTTMWTTNALNGSTTLFTNTTIGNGSSFTIPYRSRRLQDSSGSTTLLGEIDAATDPQSSDAVQAANQIQSGLKQELALADIMSKNVGRPIFFSSISTSVKIQATSVVITAASISDLRSPQFYLIMDQRLGGTLLQHSAEYGILRTPPPTTIGVNSSNLSGNSTAGVNIVADEDDANAVVVTIIVLVVVVVLTLVMCCSIPMCRRCLRRRRRLGEHQSRQKELKQVRIDLEKWESLEERIESVWKACERPLMVELDTVNQVIEKLENAAPKRRIVQGATRSQLNLITGRMSQESIESGDIGAHGSGSKKIGAPLRKLFSNAPLADDDDDDDGKTPLQKKRGQLTTKIEKAAANKDFQAAKDMQEVLDVVNALIDARDTLQEKIKRFDQVKARVREVMAHQQDAVDGKACTFWFVNAAKIRECEEPKLPEFQSLYRRDGWLVQKKISFEEACGMIPDALVPQTLAISHRWEDPKEPDEGGHQFKVIRDYLLKHAAFEYVWYDFWCMPQEFQERRTVPELREFGAMLRNVNFLYLGCSVLLLVDATYIGRFWTQLEAWLSLQKATHKGLVGAGSSERRCTIEVLHSGTDMLRNHIFEVLGNKNMQEAKQILEKPDCAVTNKGDKKQQLEKVLNFNRRVQKLLEAEDLTAPYEEYDIVPVQFEAVDSIPVEEPEVTDEQMKQYKEKSWWKENTSFFQEEVDADLETVDIKAPSFHERIEPSPALTRRKAPPTVSEPELEHEQVPDDLEAQAALTNLGGFVAAEKMDNLSRELDRGSRPTLVDKPPEKRGKKAKFSIKATMTNSTKRSSVDSTFSLSGSPEYQGNWRRGLGHMQ